MDEPTSLSAIVDAQASPVNLAVAGWLAQHSRSQKTRAAYEDTIRQFRAALRRAGADLDCNMSTIALTARAFDGYTSNPQKERTTKATANQRLAILSSFYEYALVRHLLMPMDDAGHVGNPVKIVAREKIEPYQGIHWLEPQEAEAALRKIDRSTELGKRDYALLVILFNTVRRLSEVANLEWQHVRMKGRRVTLAFEHCEGAKTMRDTLTLANSRTLLAWLYAHYGSDLMRLAKNTPVWVTLSRTTR